MLRGKQHVDAAREIPIHHHRDGHTRRERTDGGNLDDDQCDNSVTRSCLMTQAVKTLGVVVYLDGRT
jgi:hypothetical protein